MNNDYPYLTAMIRTAGFATLTFLAVTELLGTSVLVYSLAVGMILWLCQAPTKHFLTVAVFFSLLTFNFLPETQPVFATLAIACLWRHHWERLVLYNPRLLGPIENYPTEAVPPARNAIRSKLERASAAIANRRHNKAEDQADPAPASAEVQPTAEVAPPPRPQIKAPRPQMSEPSKDDVDAAFYELTRSLED
jgi:hypothetical protein